MDLDLDFVAAGCDASTDVNKAARPLYSRSGRLMPFLSPTSGTSSASPKLNNFVFLS